MLQGDRAEFMMQKSLNGQEQGYVYIRDEHCISPKYLWLAWLLEIKLKSGVSKGFLTSCTCFIGPSNQLKPKFCWITHLNFLIASIFKLHIHRYSQHRSGNLFFSLVLLKCCQVCTQISIHCILLARTGWRKMPFFFLSYGI